MKKVIHQENDIDIIVDDTICKERIMVASLVGPAYIEKENTREVAMAICPELETESKEKDEEIKRLREALKDVLSDPQGAFLNESTIKKIRHEL